MEYSCIGSYIFIYSFCSQICYMTEILSEIDDDKEEKEVEVHYGKVQFLRLEHGYIRAKSKINGIRDITFYYKDLDEDLNSLLVLGSIISFTVDQDENGKVIAKSIKIIETPQDENLHSAQVPSDVRSQDGASTLSSDSGGMLYNINNNIVEFQTIVRSPATMQLFFQNRNHSYSENNLSKSSTEESIPFENLVNLFLEKVISRDYDSSKTSCWLY